MAKNISTALLGSLNSEVTTLALCVEIVRSDGRAYYLTNHDTDLLVGDHTYDHTVPFQLSAMSSGSQMTADNVDLTLYADGTHFSLTDFKYGRFTHASCRVLLVDFTHPENGALVLRKGQFGVIKSGENGVIVITVVGLLNALQYAVGHIYTPTCNADLGDYRCKVAMSYAKVRSPLNPYNIGEWVYAFDFTETTAFTLTNPDFETDASFAIGDPITGWTLSSNARFQATGGAAALVGTQSLSGGTAAAGAAEPEEMSAYQDIDLVAQGLSTTDIDAGKISILIGAYMAQHGDLTTCPRIRYEVLNATGQTIDWEDSNYVTLDDADSWRERFIGAELIAGARVVRVYLYMLRQAGSSNDAQIDNVRGWWWDHTTTQPHSGLIHKVTAVDASASGGGGGSATATPNYVYPENASFESHSSPSPPGWSAQGGSIWSTLTTFLPSGPAASDGSRFGLNLSVVGSGATSDELWNTKALVNYGLDATAVTDGYYTGKFYADIISVGYATSFAGIFLDWLDGSSTVIETTTVLSPTSYTTVGVIPVSAGFSVPTDAVSVRIRLKAYTTNTFFGAASDIGFDHLRFAFTDTRTNPPRNTPTSGFGQTSTAFGTSTGAYTFDGALTWYAHSQHVYTDVVSAVTDAKVFEATTMSGADGDFALAEVKWLSGNNAGHRNIIRVWQSTGKFVALYFYSGAAIQVGDRFRYVRPCHKRFQSDCLTLFDNVGNFRGFPHVPGKLTA